MNRLQLLSQSTTHKSLDEAKRPVIEGKTKPDPSRSICSRNSSIYSLNKPDDFILAIVEFLADGSHRVHYVRRPFQREPDFGATSVNYIFGELPARAEAPG